MTKKQNYEGLNYEIQQLNETKYKDIVENTSDWIWEVDHEGKYTFADYQYDREADEFICPNGKRRHLSYYADASGNNISHTMIKKIESEMGRKIYPQWIAIVEPVFANIRTQKRLDKFNLRGKIKVNIQWMLYCMVHNIEKVTNYGFV